jgi:D-alanyl-D-alanine carboxypeptidase
MVNPYPAVSELIEYGFNNFEKQKLKVNKNNTISVVKGKEDQVTVINF